MGELGWFLGATGLITALLGGGILASVFAWFARSEGQVEVGGRPGSTGRMAASLAGLVIIAGILAGIIRLMRPYLH